MKGREKELASNKKEKEKPRVGAASTDDKKRREIT